MLLEDTGIPLEYMLYCARMIQIRLPELTKTYSFGLLGLQKDFKGEQFLAEQLNRNEILETDETTIGEETNQGGYFITSVTREIFDSIISQKQTNNDGQTYNDTQNQELLELSQDEIIQLLLLERIHQFSVHQEYSSNIIFPHIYHSFFTMIVHILSIKRETSSIMSGSSRDIIEHHVKLVFDNKINKNMWMDIFTKLVFIWNQSYEAHLCVHIESTDIITF